MVSGDLRSLSKGTQVTPGSTARSVKRFKESQVVFWGSIGSQGHFSVVLGGPRKFYVASGTLQVGRRSVSGGALW